jgi:hypothetical protein
MKQEQKMLATRIAFFIMAIASRHRVNAAE